MEPAHGRTVAGVAERLELGVPRRAEQPVERGVDVDLAERDLDAERLDAVLRNQNVAVQPVSAWKMPSDGVYE